MRLLKKTGNLSLFTKVCISIAVISFLILLLNSSMQNQENFAGSQKPIFMQDELFPFSYESGMCSSQNTPWSQNITSNTNNNNNKYIYCIFDNNPYISYIQKITESDISESDSWVSDYFKTVHLECSQKKHIYKIIMLYSPNSFNFNLRNLNITGYWINVSNNDNKIDRSMIVSMKPKKNIYVIPKYKTKSKEMVSQIFSPNSCNISLDGDNIEGFSSQTPNTLIQCSGVGSCPNDKYCNKCNDNLSVCSDNEGDCVGCPTNTCSIIKNNERRNTGCAGNYGASSGPTCPVSKPHCNACGNSGFSVCDATPDNAGGFSENCPDYTRDPNAWQMTMGLTNNNFVSTSIPTPTSRITQQTRNLNQLANSDNTLTNEQIQLLLSQVQNQNQTPTQQTSVTSQNNNLTNQQLQQLQQLMSQLPNQKQQQTVVNEMTQLSPSNLFSNTSPWQINNIENESINVPSAYNSCAPSLDPVNNNQTEILSSVEEIVPIPQVRQPITTTNPFVYGFPSITLPLINDGQKSLISVFAFDKPPNYVFNNHDYVLENINTQLQNNINSIIY